MNSYLATNIGTLAIAVILGLGSMFALGYAFGKRRATLTQADAINLIISRVKHPAGKEKQ